MADHECAYEPCTCELGLNEGIEGEDGRHYCSTGCRDGEGCICPDCGCSMGSIGGNDVPVIPMI